MCKLCVNYFLLVPAPCLHPQHQNPSRPPSKPWSPNTKYSSPCYFWFISSSLHHFLTRRRWFIGPSVPLNLRIPSDQPSDHRAESHESAGSEACFFKLHPGARVISSCTIFIRCFNRCQVHPLDSPVVVLQKSSLTRVFLNLGDPVFSNF